LSAVAGGYIAARTLAARNPTRTNSA